MDIAEQAAKAQKEDDININFQFYNAKNLTNSAQNITGSDENEVKYNKIKSQEVNTFGLFIKCGISLVRQLKYTLQKILQQKKCLFKQD